MLSQFCHALCLIPWLSSILYRASVFLFSVLTVLAGTCFSARALRLKLAVVLVVECVGMEGFHSEACCFRFRLRARGQELTNFVSHPLVHAPAKDYPSRDEASVKQWARIVDSILATGKKQPIYLTKRGLAACAPPIAATGHGRRLAASVDRIHQRRRG